MRIIYITLGWVIGIVLVEQGGARHPLTWGGLALMGSLSAWLMWPNRWRWAFITLVALTLGGLRASFLPDSSAIAAFNNSGGLTVKGLVVAEPDVRDDITLVRVRAETVTQAGATVPTSGLVLVRVPPSVPVAYGDVIRATGSLVTPGEYDNFSYADYLARQNTFSILRDTAVEVVETGRGNPLYGALLRLKAQAAYSINRMIPEPEAGLLVGILLGNERGISPALQADFAATGAAHIVAISGFNMVILAGVVLALLDRTPLPGLASGAIALGLMAVYTVLVGMNAAVVRAAVMTGVLVVGQSLRRRTYVPASLAFVALVMSMHMPRVLWDVSFQLSFFATLGLALFADPFTRGFEAGLRRVLPSKWAGPVGGFLAEPLVVTMAALVTTLPLTALYFNRVSLVQLPVNLFIVPVQTAVLLSGILAVLIAPLVPPVAQVVFWFDMALLAWTVGVVRWFADVPFAEIEYYASVRVIQAFFVILIGGAIVHAAQPAWALRLGRLVRSRAVTSTVVLVGVVLVGLSIAAVRARPDGHLHVHVLDVGHSNGVLIETPGGAQILVDGGRFPSRLLTQLGDIMPFYDREIEMVVITQPDEFQYGALPAVLARYHAGVILTNGQPNESDAFERLTAAMIPYPTVAVKRGYRAELSDGVVVEVLAPQQTPTLMDRLGDGAIVLRVSYGDVSFLLTSDVSREAQVELLDAGGWPAASVMQLPDHGAIRSLDEGFFEAVGPQVVLLQSDRANRRGDPDPDTLALVDETIPLVRTDEQGAVHLWTDGVTLWYDNYIPL